MPFKVTPKETEYQFGQLLAGKGYKIYLSNSSTLTEDSTSAQWAATELTSANGYVAITGTVSSGTYNTTLKQFEAAQISGTFTATTGNISFRAIILQLTGGVARTYPYAVNMYASEQTILAGQSLPVGLQIATRKLEAL
jgi:hypothetical protein